MAGTALQGEGIREASPCDSISASVSLPGLSSLSPLSPPLCHSLGLEGHRAKRERALPSASQRHHRTSQDPSLRLSCIWRLHDFGFIMSSLIVTRHVEDRPPRHDYPPWEDSSAETVSQAQWVTEPGYSSMKSGLNSSAPPLFRSLPETWDLLKVVGDTIRVHFFGGSTFSSCSLHSQNLYHSYTKAVDQGVTTSSKLSNDNSPSYWP